MQSQDPAAMMQSAGAEGTQQDTDENENDDGATVVEITFGSDGSITVEQETGAQESAEENGGGEESGGSPINVKNIDQACEVLKQMYAAAQQSLSGNSAGNPAPNKAEQAEGYSQA